MTSTSSRCSEPKQRLRVYGAFGSAPFPLANGAIIQRHIEQEVTDTAIAFAIHVRRILDNRAIRTKFTLNEPFRLWSPARGLTKVTDLREALNRIVHATEFVGFEQLPDGTARNLRSSDQ
jgi:hypothetical protein